MLLLLILITVISIIIKWYLTNFLKGWKLARQVPCPRAHLIFGNSLLYFKTSEELFDSFFKMLSKCKRRAGFWKGPFFTFLTFHPNDIEILLKSSSIADKGDCFKLIESIVGKSTFTLRSGEKLKRHKKATSPWFRTSNLKGFVNSFNRQATSLVKIFDEKVHKEFDIFPYVAEFSIINIAETVLGVNQKYLADSGIPLVELIDMLTMLAMERIDKIWLNSDLIYFLSGKKHIYKRYMNQVEDFINCIILERQKLNNSGENNSILLDILIDTHLEEKSNFSMEDVKNEILTIFFAGTSTTTTSICFNLSILGSHKNIQEKVYQEIVSIVGSKTNESISYEDALKMKYLEQVIQETHRLFAPSSLIEKIALQDIELEDGVIIPKGTCVNIAPLLLHRNPEVFNNPDEFNPDNFLPEAIKNRHSHSYIPFSMGTRACIGQKFAMFNVKITLAQILRRFKIHSNVSHKDFKLRFEVTLKRVGGHPLILSPRN